jgi:hypothetical protein
MFDSVGWFKQLELLTYSIYFSYAIFLTDYKKILKIADFPGPLMCRIRQVPLYAKNR